MADELHRVVVIGGGFGGLQCARALGGKAVKVTLVDRENHHLFQPLLYQVATAGLGPASIATPIRAVFGKDRNVEVILGEAWEVDHDRKELVLRDGDRIPYDTLVVAAGAKTNYFGHENDWAPHAHGLKDLRDAIRIRERVLLSFEAAEREPDPAVRAELLTFVVIGGGPTGVEMAGAISELGRMVLAGDYRRIHPDDIRVVLCEMADRVLTPFTEDLSYEAGVMLEELGVELHLGRRVERVTENAVHFAGEDPLKASVIVWASGVKPVSFAERLGVTLGDRGRIAVDENCAVLGHPEIFAIGDIARFVPEGEEWPLPGLAPVAMQQGRHVARQILRDLKRQPRETFRYKDKGQMATIGRARAVTQTDKLSMAGLMAWFAWLFIHVLYLVGFRNRMTVLFDWFWQYVTFGRGSRLITARHDDADERPSPLLASMPGRRSRTSEANPVPGGISEIAPTRRE
ncbi:MAG: NAD(P)/FAD-dependent oxidoreductase [Deltaproteobacteria bacterium]|nr:NAD(P)/FAD-dependent oxidoreductase [Deltaproteobacteria bacterium]